jgi:sulfur carrier protein
MTIKLIINGQPKNFTAPLNLYDVLAQEDLIGMMVAVARNNTVIPRDHWKDTKLTDGDLIEIVAPMQGG